MNLIEWCNTNNGFLTAILSLLTLVVSIIAIVVSIQTAQLPYKKRLILDSNITFLVGQNNFTGEINSCLNGITVNATNIGNRNINISFLGFAIRNNFKLQKMQTTGRSLGGTGILEPTSISTVEYSAQEMMGFGKLNSRTKVYCCAMDTEGKTYLKYYGRAGKISKSLQKMR